MRASMSAGGQGAGGRYWGRHTNSGPKFSGNQLQWYLHCNKQDETKCMNLLQQFGVISDNCVNASDVHNTGEAVKWLYDNYHKHHHWI